MMAALGSVVVAEAPLDLRQFGRDVIAQPRATFREDLEWATGIRRLFLAWSVLRFLAEVLGRLCVWLGLLVYYGVVWLFQRISAWVLRPLARLLLAIAAAFQNRYARFSERYHRVLDRSMRTQAAVLAVAMGLLVLTVGLGSTLGSELIPELHQGRFAVEMTLPVGTPLQRTLRELRRQSGACSRSTASSRCTAWWAPIRASTRGRSWRTYRRTPHAA